MTLCPEIANQNNADIELSTYDRTNGTKVVIGCKGFGRQVSDPTSVTCLETGKWSQTPVLTCRTEFDQREKVILAVSIVCAAIVLFVLLFLCCYCCCCRRRRRYYHHYHHGRGWSGWRERFSGFAGFMPFYGQSKYESKIIEDQGAAQEKWKIDNEKNVFTRNTNHTAPDHDSVRHRGFFSSFFSSRKNESSIQGPESYKVDQADDRMRKNDANVNEANKTLFYTGTAPGMNDNSRRGVVRTRRYSAENAVVPYVNRTRRNSDPLEYFGGYGGQYNRGFHNDVSNVDFAHARSGYSTTDYMDVRGYSMSHFGGPPIVYRAPPIYLDPIYLQEYVSNHQQTLGTRRRYIETPEYTETSKRYIDTSPKYVTEMAPQGHIVYDTKYIDSAPTQISTRNADIVIPYTGQTSENYRYTTQEPLLDIGNIVQRSRTNTFDSGRYFKGSNYRFPVTRRVVESYKPSGGFGGNYEVTVHPSTSYFWGRKNFPKGEIRSSVLRTESKPVFYYGKDRMTGGLAERTELGETTRVISP